VPSQIGDDVQFTGLVHFAGRVVFPASTIGDTQINASAPITAGKMEHRFNSGIGQPHGIAAVAERRVIHRAKSPGTVNFFWVGLTVANVGAATITVNLLRNGTTVLTAPVVLTSATVVYVAVTAAIASAPYSAGDVFETAITVAAGGGTLGQGAFAQATMTEAA